MKDDQLIISPEAQKIAEEKKDAADAKIAAAEEIEKKIGSEELEKVKRVNNLNSIKDCIKKVKDTSPSLDSLAVRWIRRAVILTVNKTCETINSATGSLNALLKYFDKVPADDEKEAINQLITTIKATVKEVSAQGTAVVNNLIDISAGKRGSLNNCVDFITQKIDETLDSSKNETFGDELWNEGMKDGVIELNGKLKELNEAIDVEINKYEKTESKYDDNLNVIYESFKNFVQEFKDVLDKRAAGEIGDKQLEINDKKYADIEKNYKLLVESKKIIDGIGAKYVSLLERADAIENIVEIYNIAEFDEFIKLLDKYESALIEVCKKFAKHVSGQKIEKVYNLAKEAGEELEKKYNEADKAFIESKKALNNAVNGDVATIEKSYKRVKPSVPEYATNGVVFAPDMNISGQYKTLAWSSIHGNVATLTLSAALSPYRGMTYSGLMEIVKAHSSKFYWCSLAAFKEFGLISERAEAVFIIDDGYEDYGIDSAVFSRLKSWTNCFDKKDDGKIYFSESASKKLNAMIK